MQNRLLISNQWLDGEGKYFCSTNPSNNETLWQGYSASLPQLNKAVDSARDAFPIWSSMNFSEREKYILKFTEILEQSETIFAETISKDTGKPLWESKTEIAAMKAKAQISINAYNERTGHKTNAMPGGVTAALTHKPHGVIAVFGPFNFPGHLPNGQIIPALLAGNTIIFKPSEQTALVAEKLVHLWMEADLPEGVLNLLQGEKELGAKIVGHQGIDGIFFTGSSTTGQIIQKELISNPEKIIALEMGGNNPLIIGDISDVKAAAYETIQSAYITSGQRCTCARRLYVPKNELGNTFIEQLSSMINAIDIDFWDKDPQPFMGSMISDSAAKNVLTVQEDMLMSGGESIIMSKQIHPNTGFVTPGLIDVTHVSCKDAECFGPLLQLTRYDDFHEAVKLANQTRYGLSAGLLSDKRQQFDYFLHHIRAGIINWNKQMTGASSLFPFGGVGASGNHRPGGYYMADHCVYPVASMQAEKVQLPESLTPGITLS